MGNIFADTFNSKFKVYFSVEFSACLIYFV
jgi:hypothetical protein